MMPEQEKDEGWQICQRKGMVVWCMHRFRWKLLVDFLKIGDDKDGL